MQEAMDPRQRRSAGAHYTRERDILKVIGPLFLDALEEELEQGIKKAPEAGLQGLEALHRELLDLRFFDPACGCGDFLVLTYREVRRLETRLVTHLKESGGGEVSRRVRASQFYGIELHESPARTARLAMEEMEQRLDASLGLKSTSPVIVVGNALRIDWSEVLPARLPLVIMGNPPFIGKKEQSREQREDIRLVWGDVRGAGVLDYVCAWFRKAAQYIEGHAQVASNRGASIRVGFLSTSSIAQGEQVNVLWKELLSMGVEISFAHRPFPWTSEASGAAQVHVVIIGFAKGPLEDKRLLFDALDPGVAPVPREVSSINGYLVEGAGVPVEGRRKPIGTSLALSYGSFALDGGHFTLSQTERDELLERCPEAEPYLRLYVGGEELLYERKRWCLWFDGVDPGELMKLLALRERIEAVRAWRSGRKREGTRRLADTPTRFAEVRQPKVDYLAIPTVSSANRSYVPIAFLGPEVIASNQLYVLPGATLWELGVLQSTMHLAWIRHVCGRLKSDYRYSAALVYNNFIWPEADPSHRLEVEEAARAVLEARQTCKGSLAQLYAPDAMPAALARAHAALDRAVDAAYRESPFETERERIEHLFARHARITP